MHDLENFREVKAVDDTLLDRYNTSDHMKAGSVSNDLLFYYKIYCIAQTTFACIKLSA